MTFWHTERLTKHRSSPGRSRAGGSNRAIIDDLTVRDLEPFLGHPGGHAPKGGTHYLSLRRENPGPKEDTRRTRGKKVCQKQKARHETSLSTAGRRSKILAVFVPKEKPQALEESQPARESRKRHHTILLPSPEHNNLSEDTEEPQRCRRSAE